MRKFARFVALSATLLSATTIGTTSGAFAQSVSEPPVSQEEAGPDTTEGNAIIVSGQRLAAPEEAREIVKGFVDAVVVPPPEGQFDGQLARLVGPVCPAVHGLGEANNTAVAERIRGIALAAEINVGDADCEPNVYVVLVEDGPEAIKDLRERNHRVFGDIRISRRQALQQSDGPVYGWKVTQQVPAGSSRVRAFAGTSAAAAGVAASAGEAAGSSLGNDAFNTQSTAVQSRVLRSTEKAIARSVLLIERDAVDGLSLLQLADFAAVHSLMETRNSFDPSELANPSILTLFEDRKRGNSLPPQVTEWDLALLHALYHSRGNLSASLQMSAILQIIAAEAAADNPGLVAGRR